MWVHVCGAEAIEGTLCSLHGDVEIFQHRPMILCVLLSNWTDTFIGAMYRFYLIWEGGSKCSPEMHRLHSCCSTRASLWFQCLQCLSEGMKAEHTQPEIKFLSFCLFFSFFFFLYYHVICALLSKYVKLVALCSIHIFPLYVQGLLWLI